MIERLSAVTRQDVSRETYSRLSSYVDMLLEESQRQNLIARSTAVDVWERHIIDSAQILPLLPRGARVDLGSGAGLPGLVLAILSSEPTTLVEPRKLRAAFLDRCVAELGLEHVNVVPAKAERVTGVFDAITARAVASIDDLFAAAHHLSHPQTVWVLPKGQRGKSELAVAQATWQGRFRTEPSVTEGDAVIVVASEVKARKGRG